MNLLVVDDEPIIRVGLRKLVDWESHGFRLTGEAADGVEAMNLIGDKDIDILVTDIRMPRMDGLELIRQARSVKPDMGIVVLSCLDDFNFVKEAMKLGARDYILKPTMEPEELVTILDGLRTTLQEERREKQEIEEWKAKLKQSAHYRLSAEVLQYLESGQAPGGLEETMFADAKGGLYSIMLYLPDPVKGALSDWDFQGSRAAVRLSDDGILLLYPCEAGYSLYEQQRHGYAKAAELSQRLEQLSGLEEPQWQLCVGPAMAKLADVPRNIELHGGQRHAGFYAEKLQTIVWEEQTCGTADTSMLAESRNDLLRAVSNSNADAMFHHARQLSESIRQHKPDPIRLQGFLFELLGLAAGFSRERGFLQVEQFQQKYVSMEKLRSFYHIEALNAWLLEAVRELWGSQWAASSRQMSNNPFIRKALQFMRENYNRNIGTIDIAGHVKLSRSYLSDLFSKEMGESLIETLTRIRIEEAKRKLRSGEMKVYEVAEEVGFSDPKSFAKTFKRIVGCSPKEYDLQNK